MNRGRGALARPLCPLAIVRGAARRLLLARRVGADRYVYLVARARALAEVLIVRPERRVVACAHGLAAAARLLGLGFGDLFPGKAAGAHAIAGAGGPSA